MARRFGYPLPTAAGSALKAGWSAELSPATIAGMSVSADLGTWTVANGTRATGQADADGGTAAIKLTDSTDTVATGHRVSTTAASYVAESATIIVSAAAGTLSWLAVVTDSGDAYLNASTGAVGTTHGNHIARLVSGPNGGFYRWEVYVPSLTTSNVYLYTSNGDNNGTYTGTGTGTIYFYKPVVISAHVPASLGDAAWTVSNATRTTGQSDPDGGSNAIKLADNAVNTVHYVTVSPTSFLSLPTVIYVSAKAGTLSWLWPTDGTSEVFLNAATGAIGTITGSVRAELVSGPISGWYRWRVSFDSYVGGNLSIPVSVSDANHSYVGSGQHLFLYATTLIQDRVAQLNDLSVNARHATQGTDANRPVLAPNAWNGLPCLWFDGTNDLFLADALATGFDFRGDWTLLCLVEYTNTTADFQDFVSIGASATATVRNLGRNVSNQLRTRWVDSDLSGNVYTHATIATSTKYAVAVTKSGNNRSVYVNGVKFASDPRTNDVSGLGTLNEFTLGARRLNVTDSYAQVKMRECAVVSGVLSDSLIRLYSNGARARGRLLPA